MAQFGRFACAALIAAAFSISIGGIGMSGCARPAPPSVLVIVIDSLRRDHLGIYGYERSTTPEIDAFAETATVYTNVISTAPWTTPAVASLLTSALPSTLGIHRGNRPLPDRRSLLSEVLQTAGHSTGAVVSHDYIGAKWNFDRGFDRFEELVVPAAASNAPDVTDAAIEMLHTDRPFFVFAHYFDVHFPYSDHAGFEMADGGGYDGVVRSGLSWTFAKALTQKFDADDIRQLIRFYDSEIAFTDAEVGRLLRALEDRGLTDRTLVILTSDHGEAFLERGRLGHTVTLYDELIAIPMIVRYPLTRGGEQRIGRDDRPASILDVYPTVLDVLGVAMPAGLEGISLLAQYDPARALRSETSRGPTLRGAVSGRFKLVRDLKEGSDALYDRDADPQERTDLSGDPEHAATLDRLAAEIERWPRAIERGTGRGNGEVNLDERERKRLRALGYIDE